MKKILGHVDYGVAILGPNLRASYINRAFRDIWRLSLSKAEKQPAFSELVLHGRETKAYAVPDSQLDSYVSNRVFTMQVGNVPTEDLRLNSGKVIRLRCVRTPDNGRVLSYFDVTDLALNADRLEKKLALAIELGIVPVGKNGEAQFHGGVPWQVRRAEEYIEANWGQKMDADDVAVATGTSQRTLFRAFKQSRGYSPMEFLRQSRLRHAQRMLKIPDAASTVSGIALACGFTDLAQFSKMYRSYFGESPSQVLGSAKSRIL